MKKGRISSMKRRKLSSDSIHREDDGVLAGPALAACWAAQGEGWPGLVGPARWASAQHNFGIKKISFNFQIFY
jgi:hypothetical protein